METGNDRLLIADAETTALIYEGATHEENNEATPGA
jgi:hypothetical protein